MSSLPKSHHCLESEIHVLVALDQVSRQARYRTVYDDGTEGETVHTLYWHTEGGEGEVRSTLTIEGLTPEQLPALGATLLTIDDLVGRDAMGLGSAAAVELLAAFGALGADGWVLPLAEWTNR